MTLFDRFFAFTGKACFTPWPRRPQVEHNDVRQTRKTGLRWARTIHRVRCGACHWLAALPGAVSIMAGPVLAANDAPPRLMTNQAWIEDLQQTTNLGVETVQDAFDIVFSRLPDAVFVYPTENYYYFTFTAGGIIHAGNLRLAARDRDKGILHFAAFQQANQASEAGEMLYREMTARDGVKVERLKALTYRVTYKSKPVVFQLNDVSSTQPPEDIVAAGEKYLGLVVDESGLRFFLFYNQTHKLFAYVLDETGSVLDQFNLLREDGRILIGQRSGFALYNHHYLDRRVLIGVHGANTVVNNYYDGPADQLPENHITDDNLRKAIIDADPGMKGELDEFGYLKSGEGRYLIAPYTQYETTGELAGYDQCASDPDTAAEIYDACFTAGD